MVQQMLKGYERVAFEEEGYSAAGAVPMQPPKFPGAHGPPGRTRGRRHRLLHPRTTPTRQGRLRLPLGVGPPRKGGEQARARGLPLRGPGVHRRLAGPGAW